MFRHVALTTFFLFIFTATDMVAQSCTAQLAAIESRVDGTPPNPIALREGATHGPVVGQVWNPTLDDAALLSTAIQNCLAITTIPANIPTTSGTILFDLAIPPLILSTPSGTPFAISIPDNPCFVGLSFRAQGVAIDTTAYRVSNALDIIVGSRDTLYREFSAEIDGRLHAASSPATSKPLYSMQDFATRTFIRNPDCWAADIDLTGISPWNQTGGHRRAGTLISPRHIAFANHFQISPASGNNEIVFVTNQNVTVTRHVVATMHVAADIRIGLLDADVPSTIGFHKVMPQNWASWLFEVDELPMLHLDQQEKALVRDMTFLTTQSGTCQHNTPTDPLRASFSESLIGGDSGNPAFVILDGEAIMILTHHTAQTGPFYTHYLNQVNAVMTQLGGGYQLTEFDFAAR